VKVDAKQPHERRLGTRIIDVIDHDEQMVNDIQVTVRELVWNGGGRSFEVWRTCDGVDLTADGCLDEMPTGEQIAALTLCAHDNRRVDDRSQFHCDDCGEWLGR
jgi:hypothetical protein